MWPSLGHAQACSMLVVILPDLPVTMNVIRNPSLGAFQASSVQKCSVKITEGTDPTTHSLADLLL